MRPAPALVEEALALAAARGDSVWPGWSAAPFDMVPVDGGMEYLVGSDQRPEGFGPLAGPTLGGHPVLARPRTFPPALLAAFPAFAAVTPALAAGMRQKLLAGLREDRLGERHREALYAFGAALALLLVADRPAWREARFRERFSLPRLAGAACPP